MVVSTIQLNPQKIQPQPITPAPVPEPEEIAAVDPEPEALPPPPKPKPAPKKSAPKPQPKPKPKAATPKPPPPKKPVPDKKAELLAKAQASMQKIDKTVNLGTVSSLEIESLVIDTTTTLNAVEISYRDEIASRLKLALKLPEMGEVKLKLTLNRSGSVTNVEIIHSASKANKTYIQSKLPTMKFPAFGNNFGNSPSYTFTIALSNEL